MRRLVEIVPAGGLVLDPFMGSASTAIAALELGRSFIGIESDGHWFEVARRRIMDRMKGARTRVPAA